MITLNHTDKGQTKYTGLNVEPWKYHADGMTIADLEKWGANLVRLHIIESKWAGPVSAGIHHALRIVMDAMSRKSDIKFIWNLRLECQCDYRAHLAHWQDIVPMVDRMPNTLGYDIVNEPWDFDTTMRGWKAALPVFHQAMRKMTSKVIMVQSGHWGSDSGFEILAPFGDANTWYGCNIYTPWYFTAQGLSGMGKGHRCPDNMRELLEKEKGRLLAWKKQWPDAQIFVPEIGLSKHVPDEEATKWLREVVAFLDELGAHWCWHNAHESRERPPREILREYF